MEVKKVEFIKSLGIAADYKSLGLPEIALAGRSNVGKSSFINMLGRSKKLARVSVTPGKTRLINIFRFNDRFLLMDLPGYGYAKISNKEKQRFGELMEGYFAISEQLKNVFLLLDIRHSPSSEDMQMLAWLYRYAVPFTILATKTDKLSRSKIRPNIDRLARECGIVSDMIIPVSSVTGQGRDEVLKRISEIIA